MINTNNCGKDPEENVKPYIWNLKRSQSHKFSHKGFLGEEEDRLRIIVHTLNGVGLGVGKGE